MRRSHEWHRWLPPLLLVALLAGCGGPGAASADEVHRQFVAAIRRNDQAAVTRFVAPAARMTVGSIPERVYLDTVNPRLIVHQQPAGPFVRVEVLPVRAAGAARVGRSVWRYQHAALCYTTTLGQEADGWRVRSLYVDLHGCTAEELR